MDVEPLNTGTAGNLTADADDEVAAAALEVEASAGCLPFVDNRLILAQEQKINTHRGREDHETHNSGC